MAGSPIGDLLQALNRAALRQDGAGLSDGELLEAFVARRDAAVFEALVRRHGPMVLGVCRRVLHNAHDAEDAFQATFLVLVRRAASVVPRELVGNFLYGVAYRTALEARRAAARRRARERQVSDMPHPRVEADESWRELLPLLDRELERLPPRYRAPVVLCHLEGQTRKEAAGHLGLPVGTLSGRLTTAMRLLAKRLRRHGLALSAGTLAAVLSPQAVAALPTSLVAATMQALPPLAAGQASAAGAVSAEVAALTTRVLKGMLLAKLKWATAVLLAVAAVGGGITAFAHRTPDAGREEARLEGPARADGPGAAKEADARKSDRERLQGFWVPVSSEVDGFRQDGDPKLKQWELAFDGDTVTMPGNHKVPYSLDPRKQPGEMDIAVDEKPIPMRLIYEFEGDRLKLCWRKSGERPADFDTRKGRGTVRILFQRGDRP
jgi:RNA polymerase sigma-70 factor (ECF subfamily)